MNILSLNNVSKSFGGIKANVDISLEVVENSITGLIGPNGCGKTTLFNSIVGQHPIDSGEVYFYDQEISHLTISEIARLGIVRTFQQTHIYKHLNCIDNMLVSLPYESHFKSLFRSFEKEKLAEVEELLEFVGLYPKRKLLAGDLSFGQQKLLEFAMAIVNKPKLLLLDEPTGGINPTLINSIIDCLKRVNQDFKITLLVIEHNMRVMMNLAEKIYCLSQGKVLADGTPSEIKNSKMVIDAYLGG